MDRSVSSSTTKSMLRGKVGWNQYSHGEQRILKVGAMSLDSAHLVRQRSMRALPNRSSEVPSQQSNLAG